LTRAGQAHLHSLIKDKQARHADGTFVVEGAKAVRDAIRTSGHLIRMVVTTPEFRAKEPGPDRTLRESLSSASYSCTQTAFSRLSDVETPQGILAVLLQPVWSERAVFAEPALLGVFCEQVQDPVNVGTIIRTAAGLGASALWLTPDSADQFSPKVVRGTAGAILSLPIFPMDDVEGFVREGCLIYAADVSDSATVEIVSIKSIPPRLILAFGNEGRGLSARTRDAAACRFNVPLHRGVESLNVASAVAIAIHHFVRLHKAT
jgi:TrmH family RNA methyltransferase